MATLLFTIEPCFTAPNASVARRTVFCMNPPAQLGAPVWLEGPGSTAKGPGVRWRSDAPSEESESGSPSSSRFSTPILFCVSRRHEGYICQVMSDDSSNSIYYCIPPGITTMAHGRAFTSMSPHETLPSAQPAYARALQSCCLLPTAAHANNITPVPLTYHCYECGCYRGDSPSTHCYAPTAPPPPPHFRRRSQPPAQACARPSGRAD